MAHQLIWPMKFPDQTCNRCLKPVAIESAISDHDAEGKLVGWHHAEECAPDV